MPARRFATITIVKKTEFAAASGRTHRQKQLQKLTHRELALHCFPTPSR